MYKRISRAELVLRRLKASDQSFIFSALIGIAKQKKYKRQWVDHKFKALFGNWPRFGEVPPTEPSSDLLTWLDRERRRYGTTWKKERMKVEAKARNASALLLLRIEAILAELEANPLAKEPCCQQESDGEALDIVGRICARKAAVPGGLNHDLGLTGESEPSPPIGNR